MRRLLLAALLAVAAGSAQAQQSNNPSPCYAATSSAIGCVKPDNSTITVDGSGTISAGGVPASSITIGTTTITGGVSGQIIYDNAGVIGELATTGTGNVVLATAPTLTLDNATGLPLTTGVTGILPAANGGTGINNGLSTLTLAGSLSFSALTTANRVLVTTASGTVGNLLGGNNGSVLLGVTGGIPNFGTMSKDCTITNSGSITCTSTGGVAFSALATTTPGTGVATALGVNIGTAGAVLVKGTSVCADLSNGATGCSTATGTSGATIPLLNGANTWSGVQSFNSGDLALKGATSGTITLNAAAVAGSNTLTLPAGTTDFSATGGTSQVVKQTSAGGAFTVARLACSDLSNAAASCSTDATSATNITSGTLGPARLNGLNSITNSIAGDVSLNNTANYFDGPSIAQGTTGTWWVSGTVTVTDTAASAAILCKLWDGTTVISSGAVNVTGATLLQTIALSGYLATPAANLRISCRDLTTTTGVIKANASGAGSDSTISAFRIN